MKLLLCSVCHDVQALCHVKRTCACGLSWGSYDDDGLHATVGGEGLVLGLLNSGVEQAVHAHEDTPDDQYTLACWMFPEPHRRITYTES